MTYTYQLTNLASKEEKLKLLTSPFSRQLLEGVYEHMQTRIQEDRHLRVETRPDFWRELVEISKAVKDAQDTELAMNGEVSHTWSKQETIELACVVLLITLPVHKVFLDELRTKPLLLVKDFYPASSSYGLYVPVDGTVLGHYCWMIDPWVTSKDAEEVKGFLTGVAQEVPLSACKGLRF